MRFLLYPTVALALSGCNLLSGKCTYEIRSFDGAGSVSDAGSELATAEITFSEQRGSLQSQSMYWLVLGPSLKGHVLSASFKDASDLSRVLLDLPLATVDRTEISQGAVGTGTGANLGGFHDILAAGRGIVELRTDLSSRPTVLIPITATNSGDWIRPYCS